MKKILLLLCLGLAVGCVKEPKEGYENPPLLLMQGSWKSCVQTDVSQSLLVHITFTGNQLAETISSWDQLNCVGNQTIQLQFNAEVTVETALGKSNYVAGATDFYLKPDTDIFGCGVGVAAYTLIKFTDNNFNAFNPGATQPQCSSAGRDTSLNTGMLFTKE